jgi:succinate dehydrogenase / fumarate reductase iron-sulfur subunit
VKGRFDIFRKKPAGAGDFRQVFEVEVRPGDVLLDVFHHIQAHQDPTFAYRYSCRGAICGSCAVRVNGAAALACRTQALPLAKVSDVRIDPLLNMPVIRDLVCDFMPFWEAWRRVRPFLDRDEEKHDEKMNWEKAMTTAQLDQLRRCVDCIRCGACFSDCPKRGEGGEFIGPAACVDLFRFFFDPRDGSREKRGGTALAPGGIFDCDSHANCVKVCPKDVRPLRAITFMKREFPASREE